MKNLQNTRHSGLIIYKSYATFVHLQRCHFQNYGQQYHETPFNNFYFIFYIEHTYSFNTAFQQTFYTSCIYQKQSWFQHNNLGIVCISKCCSWFWYQSALNALLKIVLTPVSEGVFPKKLDFFHFIFPYFQYVSCLFRRNLAVILQRYGTKRTFIKYATYFKGVYHEIFGL